MSESQELGARLISVEIPVEAAELPEIVTAVAGLREVVEAHGGQVFDRRLANREGLDLTNDEEFRHAAQCADHMRALGLLHPNLRVADLTMAATRPQRLEQGGGTHGLAAKVLGALWNVGGPHRIHTVRELLTTTLPDLYDLPKLGDKGLSLLKQTLIASGMPQEFPWPFNTRGDTLLRGLVLLTSNFSDLPPTTQATVAFDFGLHPMLTLPLSAETIMQARVRYAERRRELLVILAK